MIKRLKQQVKDLEQEKTDVLNKRGAVGGVVQNKGTTRISVSGGSPKKKMDDSKGNEDLINFLEHKLEEIEKKLANTQNEYEVLQNDYMEL